MVERPPRPPPSGMDGDGQGSQRVRYGVAPSVSRRVSRDCSCEWSRRGVADHIAERHRWTADACSATAASDGGIVEACGAKAASSRGSAEAATQNSGREEARVQTRSAFERRVAHTRPRSGGRCSGRSRSAQPTGRSRSATSSRRVRITRNDHAPKFTEARHIRASGL